MHSNLYLYVNRDLINRGDQFKNLKRRIGGTNLHSTYKQVSVKCTTKYFVHYSQYMYTVTQDDNDIKLIARS